VFDLICHTSPMRLLLEAVDSVHRKTFLHLPSHLARPVSSCRGFGFWVSPTTDQDSTIQFHVDPYSSIFPTALLAR
jgi:hypothetical protein